MPPIYGGVMRQLDNTNFTRHNKRAFVWISLIIFCLDLIFVAINYHSSRQALNMTLLQRAKTHQNEFNLALDMTYRNMLQLSTFISNNSELNQLFLAGKKAVEKEGGGAGGEESKQLRQDCERRLNHT